MKKLTVKELIEKLQVLPPEAIVLVDGYETGFDAVVDTEIINIEKNVEAEWYNGIYEESNKLAIQAIYLLNTRNIR